MTNFHGLIFLLVLNFDSIQNSNPPTDLVKLNVEINDEILIAYHNQGNECTGSPTGSSRKHNPSETFLLDKDGVIIAEFRFYSGQLSIRDDAFKGRLERTSLEGNGVLIKNITSSDTGLYTLYCKRFVYFPVRKEFSSMTKTQLNVNNPDGEVNLPEITLSSDYKSTAIDERTASSGQEVVFHYESRSEECTKTPIELKYFADYPVETFILLKYGETHPLAHYDFHNGEVKVTKEEFKDRIKKEWDSGHGLKLTNVTKDDDGLYILQCHSYLYYPKPSTKFQESWTRLTVVEEPFLEEGPEEEIKAIIGQPVMIKFRSNPQNEVILIKNGINVPKSKYMVSENGINFLNFEQSDGGIYILKVLTETGESKSYPISMEGGKHDVEAVEDTNLVLDCSIEGAEDIKWLYKNRSIAKLWWFNSAVDNTTNRLTVYNVRRSMSGMYSCSDGDNNVESIKVMIFGPPVIRQVESKQMLKFGKVGLLECPVTAPSLPSFVTWKKDKKSFPDPSIMDVDLIESGRIVLFKRVSSSASGYYRCYAHNRHGHTPSPWFKVEIKDDGSKGENETRGGKSLNLNRGGICPTKSEIRPCTCNEGEKEIVCKSNKKIDLEKIFEVFDLYVDSDDGYGWNSLVLEGDGIRDINYNTFKDFRFKKIKFNDCFKLNNVNEDAFVGNDVTEEAIFTTNSITSSIFGSLNKFRSLRSVYFQVNDNLSSIPDMAFSNENSILEEFNILNSGLDRIGDAPFYGLSNLKNLNFFALNIKNVSNRMFEFEKTSEEPLNVTFEYVFMDFNQLGFENVSRPINLRIIDSEKFTYMDESTFGPLLKDSRHRLIMKSSRYSMEENYEKLNCKDCRNSWIAGDEKIRSRIEGLHSCFMSTEPFNECYLSELNPLLGPSPRSN